MSIYTTSTGGVLAGWVKTDYSPRRTFINYLGEAVEVYTNTLTIAVGEISELSVQAIFSTSTVYPNYKIITNGALVNRWTTTATVTTIVEEGPPPITTSTIVTYITTATGLPAGLTFYRDGTIGGRPEYSFNFTNTETTTFYVNIVDQNNNLVLDTAAFDLVLSKTTSTQFTTLFAKPLLTQQKRQEFKNFINNTDIFIPSLIYRKFDPNFGVQKELKLFIEYGLRKFNLSTYSASSNPTRTKLSLNIGNIKTAIAKNAAGVITYELIYLEVIDKHSVNTRLGVPTTIRINGVTYYPPSILNIRAAIAGATDKSPVREPRWTNTIQPDDSIPPEYNYSIPLCFTLPGKSEIIFRKIQENGFKFNTIKYDVDRFIVESTFDYANNKYIALPRDSKIA